MSFLITDIMASMTMETYRLICAGGLGLILIGITLAATGLLILFKPAPSTSSDKKKAVITRIFEASSIGMRESQQDSFLSSNVVPTFQVRNKGSLGVVCDGMGGLEGGELASRLCTETLVNGYYDAQDTADTCAVLKEMILTADRKVSKLATKDGRILNCGTTVVVAALKNNVAYWASAGDSRIYHINSNGIQQITRDHNFRITLTERYRAGQISAEDIEKNPQKNALISFVGKGKNLIIDTGSFPHVSGGEELILLCSDGIYKALSDNEILYTVHSNMDRLAELPEILISTALQNKRINHDNITVMIIN